MRKTAATIQNREPIVAIRIAPADNDWLCRFQSFCRLDGVSDRVRYNQLDEFTRTKHYKWPRPSHFNLDLRSVLLRGNNSFQHLHKIKLAVNWRGGGLAEFVYRAEQVTQSGPFSFRSARPIICNFSPSTYVKTANNWPEFMDQSLGCFLYGISVNLLNATFVFALCPY